MKSPVTDVLAPGDGAPIRRRFPVARMPSAAAIVFGVALVATLLLLVLVAEILPVFIIGLLVAFVLDPVVTWLAAHRVPRGLAALLAMAGLAILLGAFSLIFLDTVLTQAAAFIALLPAAFAELEAWLLSLGLPPGMEAELVGVLDSLRQSLLQIDITVILEPLLSGLLGLLGAFFTLLVLPFFMFYVLSGRPALVAGMREMLPAPWRDDIEAVFAIVSESFGTYVRAEAIVMVILGVLAWIGLMLLSIFVDPKFAEYALLLALIAGVSELIPNFGPWIAVIPAVLFALTISPEAVLATIVLYTILMFLEGQVLVPKIEGGAFSFHAALVLFLVVAGVAIMGILGAILALPVAAAIWRTTRYAFRRAAGQPAQVARAGAMADAPIREEAEHRPAADTAVGTPVTEGRGPAAPDPAP